MKTTSCLLSMLFLACSCASIVGELASAQTLLRAEVDSRQTVFEQEIDPAYQERENDGGEVKLQKEKIRAAIEEIAAKKKRVQEGQDSVFFLFESQQRLTAALLDFHKEPIKIIQLLEQQVQEAQEVEDNRKLRFQNGMGRPDEFSAAKFFRADAELQLLRAKRKFKLLDDDG